MGLSTWLAKVDITSDSKPCLSIQIHSTYLGYASTGNYIQHQYFKTYQEPLLDSSYSQAILIASTLLDAYYSEY